MCNYNFLHLFVYTICLDTHEIKKEKKKTQKKMKKNAETVERLRIKWYVLWMIIIKNTFWLGFSAQRRVLCMCIVRSISVVRWILLFSLVAYVCNMIFQSKSNADELHIYSLQTFDANERAKYKNEIGFFIPRAIKYATFH